MKIAIDARPLSYPANGNGRYLHFMLKYIIPLRKNDSWHLFFNKPLHPEYKDLLNLPVTIHYPPVVLPGLLWLNFILPFQIKSFDMFWGTLAMLPLFYRFRNLPVTMVNFHDLNAFSAPQTMTFFNQLQHRLLDGHTIRNADSILCLSKTTGEDIKKHFPGAKKLHTIYPGFLSSKKVKKIKPLKNLKEGFYLCVGTIEPRKNQRLLIEAYSEALLKNEKLMPLVLIGRKGWGEDILYRDLLDQKYKGIIYLHQASEEHLQWCYAHAGMFMLPSLHEGFGLPILEAMEHGLPCALSDIPVFREIAPGASFARPDRKEDWVRIFLSKKKKVPSRLDRLYWSWEKRAQVLSEVMDQMKEKV